MGTKEDEKQPFKRCLKGYDGYECTAWALFNENMDYFRCQDLSWNEKTRCK